jgi:hypothetical protein
MTKEQQQQQQHCSSQHRTSSSPATATVSDEEGEEDSTLSSRLNNLSLEERSQGLYDLHGVADLRTETPEVLKQKFSEMTEILSRRTSSMGHDDDDESTTKCSDENFVAYQRALELDSNYVESLKLPCLRAANYDDKEAAALLLRLFRQKLDLFGEDKLVRDIRLDDILQEEEEDDDGNKQHQEADALRKGIMHILPHRDRSGRTILLNDGRINQQYEDFNVVVSKNLILWM